MKSIVETYIFCPQHFNFKLKSMLLADFVGRVNFQLDVLDMNLRTYFTNNSFCNK